LVGVQTLVWLVQNKSSGKSLELSENKKIRVLLAPEAMPLAFLFIYGQVYWRKSWFRHSGVDSRIFGRFLEFISKTEHRGKILWIGASNFPDKIDPAMKRAGRFDFIWPFLLPDQQSRKAILKVLLEGELEGIYEVQLKSR